MLRDYQRECKDSVIESLQHHRRVMFSLPTGTGKTKTALSIAASDKFLFIVHRDFLATQTAQAFGNPIAIRTGKHKSGDLSLSCVCTIQWLLAKGNIDKLPCDHLAYFKMFLLEYHLCQQIIKTYYHTRTLIFFR